MNIRIESTLTDPPESRTTLSGEAALIFRVATVGWPVEARVKLGKEPEAFIRSRRLAAMCQRGDAVVLEATGLSPRTDHSVAAILLHGVSQVKVVGRFVVPGLLR